MKCLNKMAITVKSFGFMHSAWLLLTFVMDICCEFSEQNLISSCLLADSDM